MPHLHCQYGGREPDPADIRGFTAALTKTYAEEMDTSTGHIAVTVDTKPLERVTLGRAEDGPRFVLDADIRRGRPLDQRRAFALAALALAGDYFDVPETNGKVVFTEHDGTDMMGVDRVGGEWSA